MSVETSAAVVAISLAILTVVVIVVMVAILLLLRRVAMLVATVHQQVDPILTSVRHTAETLQDIGDSAQVQMRRLERVANRVARATAGYSAVIHGVAIAVAALFRKKGA